MKAALLINLLASIRLLQAAADITNIPIYPNFDAQRLAGTWYRIEVVLKNKEPVNTIPFDDVVEPSNEGDLVLKMRYILDGTCQETRVDVVHTNNPGVFEVPSTSETVHMVDVDYDSYHIVHVELNDSHSLYLLSRTREASDEVKTTFRTLAETLGFDVNQIIDVSLAEILLCESMEKHQRKNVSAEYTHIDRIKPCHRENCENQGFMPIMLPSTGKSEFGGMFEECTTSIISIMVLQMTLTTICHIF